MCAVHFSDFEGILEYIEPRTIAEACSLLTQCREDKEAKVATTLVPR